MKIIILILVIIAVSCNSLHQAGERHDENTNYNNDDNAGGMPFSARQD